MLMRQIVYDRYLFPLLICCGLAAIFSALFFDRIGVLTYPLVMAIGALASWLLKRIVYGKADCEDEAAVSAWGRGKYLCVGILGGLVILTGFCIFVAYWIMFIVESLK